MLRMYVPPIERRSRGLPGVEVSKVKANEVIRQQGNERRASVRSRWPHSLCYAMQGEARWGRSRRVSATRGTQFVGGVFAVT